MSRPDITITERVRVLGYDYSVCGRVTHLAEHADGQQWATVSLERVETWFPQEGMGMSLPLSMVERIPATTPPDADEAQR